MIPLEPCWRCGKAPKTKWKDVPMLGISYTIRCGCMCGGVAAKTVERAVEMWNQIAVQRKGQGL